MDTDFVEEESSQDVVAPRKVVRRRTTSGSSVRGRKRVNEEISTADDIPERFSTDIEKTDYSDNSVNDIQDSAETWAPNRPISAVDDDLPVSQPIPRRPMPNTASRQFSTDIGDTQNVARIRPIGRPANNRFQPETRLPRTATNTNVDRRQQTFLPNRQKFAKTVRIGQLSSGAIKSMECLESFEKLSAFAKENINTSLEPFDFNKAYESRAQLSPDVIDDALLLEEFGKSSHKILEFLLIKEFSKKRPIVAKGVLETIEGGDGLLVYANDNYRIRPQSAFIPRFLIQKYGLRRGQDILAYLHPPAQSSTCPFVLQIVEVLGENPESVYNLPKFKDLVPFYPTERLLLECPSESKWDNTSMRIVDLFAPIGLGQRGLVVAPPRTGKTVLLQGIANAISTNRPDVKLIILLIDERPEEVTDFHRQVPKAEIISSTFDESADNHIHAADMVIDKARRYVEAGKHVVVLLDSITRLARAHNTEQPSSGKLLSGGVDASALQSPKRFFGAARNIEGGGSLTIIATALIETGSRMDDVIFEEFKGTGNMELHLDRSISERRIFPAFNIEKSGTRKEELLYHPDEMSKVYTLRRAIQDVPPIEAMEMLVQRMRSTKTNAEFLLNVNR